MNRNNEFYALVAALDNTPPALEYAVTRAAKRARRARRVRRFLAIPVGSVATFFLTFVALVNLYTPFAMACGGIPLLRELAAAVAFSPSLSAAVENRYVQPIEQEQTIGDITMRVEYLIVDQKQINIFYNLRSQVFHTMSADIDIAAGNRDGESLEGYALSSGTAKAGNGELRHVVVDFIDNDVPDNLVFSCKVFDLVDEQTESVAPKAVQHGLHETYEPTTPEYDAVFKFDLSFDPAHTVQGEIITLNQGFELDGQHLTAASVEIYPTHIRLNLEDDPNNTAWLQSMSFYFENEKGERFEPIGNGISATGSPDSPMMRSHRLESSFFSESNSLVLYITDVVWLDKDMERVAVDLAGATAERLPQGVRFETATRVANGWNLTFSAVERAENSSYQLFGSYYYDERGEQFMYNRHTVTHWQYVDDVDGRSVEVPGRFAVQFSLVDYEHDMVYLSPSFSRSTTLETPVVIAIK